VKVPVCIIIYFLQHFFAPFRPVYVFFNRKPSLRCCVYCTVSDRGGLVNESLLTSYVKRGERGGGGGGGDVSGHALSSPCLQFIH